MKNVLSLSATVFAAMTLFAHVASAEPKEILIAEPQHGIGYLPLYVAIDKGFFSAEGIDAKILTVDGGGTQTNAVLTKQAFAFIGGPEHDAFAKLKGAELRCVINIVNRGNVYMVARADAPKMDGDLKAYLKGKKIATGFYGGTPNSITRYVLAKNGLDFKADAVVQEMANGAITAALKAKQADIGIMSEPILTAGVKQGIWNEPFYNTPKQLGAYAYSTMNIREESIKQDPELVRGFVRAMAKGLKFTHDHQDEAAEIAKKEFPTMAAADVKATLDRAFADELWSEDGTVTPEAWQTAEAVVMEAGLLKQEVPYADIFDMSFLNSVKDAL
jgi:NitT/TauT family transport system substrate-binding protein